MNLFFEDDGAFKAGTLLSSTGASHQVELPTGRRTKIKDAKVFERFEAPEPAEFLEKAQIEADQLDSDFLWEVAPEGEFGYEDIAGEYYGEGASAMERAAVLIKLHASPVYFHRKGHGHFRKAPEEILKMALAALEKKRILEEKRKGWVAQMVSGTVPPEIAGSAIDLLVRPDRNSIEWKALSDAAAETRRTPLDLLLGLGAIRSPYAWHVESFYRENFPDGRGFPADLPAPDLTEVADLPLAAGEAFSIDDSSTTEIDDALSVRHLPDGLTRVGVHIAVPSLGFHPGDAVDKFIRGRLSTVYAPGLKTTMLPDSWVKAFSLDEGMDAPVLSLYATVSDETMGVLDTETRLEKIHIAANLRYDLIDHLVTEEGVASDTLELPFGHEMSYLWRLSKKLQAHREEVRGRPERPNHVDWFFELDGEGEDARITIKGRRRGAPLDLLVAEMMIFANSTWGKFLEDRKVAGIYRSQRMGRVRMSTTPGPHDGLGVECYAWSTSPLRRFVDMVNQRQLVAAASGTAPAFGMHDVDLYTAVSAFENVYGIYNDFQRRMERYWSLRWIEQEGLSEIEATVGREEVICATGLPLVQRIPGLPELPRGQKILLRVLGFDYINLLLEARLEKVLEGEIGEEDEEEEVADSAGDVPAQESAGAAAPADPAAPTGAGDPQ